MKGLMDWNNQNPAVNVLLRWFLICDINRTKEQASCSLMYVLHYNTGLLQQNEKEVIFSIKYPYVIHIHGLIYSTVHLQFSCFYNLFTYLLCVFCREELLHCDFTDHVYVITNCIQNYRNIR